MKTTQYLRMEKAIATADSSGIHERWLWGLRLLRDPEAMASEKSLRHGVADQLIDAAARVGRSLSIREIQWRLQCARAYPTEAQMRTAGSHFKTWADLRAAGFPAFDAPDGEPLADHRTEEERRRDHARALTEQVGDQGALFPLATFEPITTTLKELADYADQQEEITERFARHDRKRRAYLDQLVAAAGGDLSMTWQSAHDRAGLDEIEVAS